MTTDIYQIAQNWLRWDRNPKTHKEISQLVQDKNESELKARLESRIAFGTAGLRGPMKAGFSCMNDLTVIQASQGLCMYVKQTLAPDAERKGIVVGYDGRYNSEVFAKLTAATFVSQGFKVHLFSRLVPTPFVAFAVPFLKACVGVMITASHNPKDDNGYKVYWDNGCQINTPHDKGIAKQIELNLEPWNVFYKEYFDRIERYTVRHNKQMAREKIVYSAMHGVGGEYTKRAFEVFALDPFIAVKEQFHPDPAFPTVTFPNPEEGKGALKLSIETAEANNNWAWKNGKPYYEKGLGSFPNDQYFMINTAVSSAMLKTMAMKEGFTYEEVLTGFKWVGNAAQNLIEKGKHLLFAYEEAIGFMYGDVSLDKDGVRCAPIFAELAQHLYSKGSSCQDHLEELYKRYGYHISKNRYFFCYDPLKMEKIFNRIRNGGQYPTKCGDFEITRIRDLTTGYDTGYPPENKAQLPTSTSTQMITFYFKNGGIATLRGSGTEPKLKYYVEMIGDDKENVELILQSMVDQVINQFLRPIENELIPPKD
uniref:Phosphoglucomutase n=1 Tax=Coremiostelium polycephalum TaxID=142831 RepID=A0A1L2FV51_9MYCE|nr:phosphoglucomutase [Coremiostelium polycephalum]